MTAAPINTCPCEPLDLADLLKNPDRELTPYESERFEEAMSFKNKSKSAKSVSLTSTIQEVKADIDYYLGLKRSRG